MISLPNLLCLNSFNYVVRANDDPRSVDHKVVVYLLQQTSYLLMDLSRLCYDGLFRGTEVHFVAALYTSVCI